MANRRHTPRRVKRLRTYNVSELARATDASPATVRAWARNGLEAVPGVYPAIFRGVDVISFLTGRDAGRKHPCGPGRMYCLRCKEPQRPAFGEVDFYPQGESLGRLTGLCPQCGGLMHRRASRATVHAAVGDLRITFQCAETRLSRTPDPHS